MFGVCGKKTWINSLIILFMYCNTSLAITVSSNPDDYSYHQYSDNHWSRRPCQDGSCIASIKYHDQYNYIIQLNPTDRRGYRIIIRYLGKNKIGIESSFNRSYSIAEQRGLLEISILMTKIYQQIGLPIVQIADAGNNTQSIDPDNIKIQLGNDQEPSVLHLHMWGRGVQKKEYIEKVKLLGPKLGESFDMSNGKISWDYPKLQLAVNAFKSALIEYSKHDEFNAEFGSLILLQL